VPDGTKKFHPPLIIEAQDADEDDKIIYSIKDLTKNDSGIQIDAKTGEISLEKPLR